MTAGKKAPLSAEERDEDRRQFRKRLQEVLDHGSVAETYEDPLNVFLLAGDIVQKVGDGIRASRANARAIDQQARALRRADAILSFAALLLPRRLRDEEIGDALEVIHALVRSGCPPWQVYVKVGSTLFWLAWGLVREAIAVLRGKSPL